ncbi:aspartate/glutamate racemase family protein [Psychromarinibacter sp. C21-152]|uniref:Aspartate/glutamate racemase family protein n=1 Tax=Psychromarinibacter sediminicola TaxID=3033385 RepID=A0AAE3NRQ2_9RHOB|nr:aspartate/glutamate racemase family protein [Psychromarinibacter sediminicola]MDF0603063.1 aspartate/glutamate racemase family protein [Psychromarinibacter sediminicola]
MKVSYDLSEPALAGRLGLIVLQVDETIESDFRRLFADPAVALHVTRIPSGAELTPGTIASMEMALPAAAALLPGGVRYDSIGYACTSGTTLIGPDRVAALVAGARGCGAVDNPLSAAVAAMRHLGCRRIGMVTPYIASVAAPMRDAFAAAGIEVAAAVSFGEEVESRVARISPASTREAARAVARQAGVEAVFLSCTNLRTLDVIAPLEAELGVPVLSSNLALAWRMARRIGRCPATAPGRLFAASTDVPAVTFRS